MQIDLKVRHQRILGVQQVPRLVIEKTRLFVYLNIDFDEEWDDCGIVVVLTNDYNAGHPIEMHWAGVPLEVPDELLVTGTLRLSCVGTRRDGTKLTTKYMGEGVRIHRSGAPAGFNPSDVVPELWEQVLAAVGNVGILQTQAKGNVVAAVNEIYAKGIKSIEQTKASNVSEGLNEFMITFNDDTVALFEWKNGARGATGEPGKRGAPGPAGVGISSIYLLGEVDGGNEYAVQMTDGTRHTFVAPRGRIGLTGKAGKDGATGKDGVSVTVQNFTESTADGGSNVIRFSDGTSLTVLNGRKGSPGVAGRDGRDGQTPSIGSNGNWWISGIDTGVRAEGRDGVSFETDDTLTLENGVLSVNTAESVEQDNTRPITSAAVYSTVGNIELLLKTI